MTLLMQSLADWNSPAFSRTLKQELERLPTGVLPLAEATGQGGFVDDSDISVSTLNSHDEGTAIHAKVGVFFTEIVVGCGCGVDPMEINAYCEMQVSIDKETAQTVFKVLTE